MCCSAAARHSTICGQENCGSMIWGEVDHVRRLKALLLGFAIVVALVSLLFGAVAALG